MKKINTHNRLTNFLMATVMVITACFSLTACSNNTVDKSVLNIADVGESTDMYPVTMTENNRVVDKLVFETLVTYENNELKPLLATSWSSNESMTEWTIDIRQGVTFHDGEKLDAQAVYDNLYDWRYGPLAGTFTVLQAVSTWTKCEIVSEYQIKLTYDTGYYFTMYDFCWPDVTVIVSPKQIAIRDDGNDSTMTTPVGTGPYTYGEYVKGEKTTFNRNANYWNGTPAFEKVVDWYIPDDATRLQALQTGKVDIIFGSAALSYDSYDLALTYKDVEGKISSMPSGQRNLTVNYNGILGEKAIREAIAYAINQEEIAAGVCNGYEKESNNVNTLGGLFYDEMPDVKYSYNVETAKTTLEAAGWVDANNDGFREKDSEALVVKCTVPSDDASKVAMAEVLKTQLATVGISLTVEQQDSMVWMYSFYDMENLTNFDMTFQNTYYDYATPVLWFGSLNMMAQCRSMGLLENAEQIQAYMAQIKTTIDSDELITMFKYLTEQTQDQYLDIPLVTANELIVYNTSKIKSYDFKGDYQFFNPANVTVAD